MNKFEYLVAACKAEAWRRLIWRISIFNVCTFPMGKEDPELYDLSYVDGLPHYWEEGKWTLIEGVEKNQEIFYAEDRFMLTPEMYPGLTESFETGVGRYVFNWIVIFFAFGTRLPYLKDAMSPLVYQSDMFDRCLDSEDDEPENDAAIRPSMIGRFNQGMHEIAPMCVAVAPTGTIRSLTVHPDTYKVRDALLLKHKDELDNPAVVVMIEKALDALDKEWLSGDQSIQFYASKKAVMRRRKLMLIYGISSAFTEGANYTLIPTSLVEDTGMDNLVAKFNETREGSFMRGAETAKGGEFVRIIQMIFQNHRIVDGDCGTKLTHALTVTEFNKRRYSGMNYVENGKTLELTDDVLKSKVGKIIQLRRPILCQQGHVDCCAACASANKSKEPRAIAADLGSGMSNIMLNAMGAMHGKETVVVEYDTLIHIS